MKLDYEDLLKIQEEMEQQEILALKRYLSNAEEYYDEGLYYSLLHEDAGDRD